MPKFYQPDLTSNVDNPFVRDGNDKLIRRITKSRWEVTQRWSYRFVLPTIRNNPKDHCD